MIKGCSNLIYISLLLFYPYISISQSRILITSDFPGGNIELLGIEQDTVWLKTDNSFTEGEWFYWYFKASNINGRKISFKFEQENVFARYGPAYSINNDQTWKWYGEKRIKENTFTFTFNEEDSIAYFSMAFLYVEQNLMSFLSTLQNREDLIIDSLCTSPEGRTIQKITIKPVRHDAEHKVLITARHHACEIMASYVMEGIIESILNDKNCSPLRVNTEFIFIPFIDKDGVENGEQGKNRIPRDHNRDYLDESIHHSTAALRNTVPEWSDNKLKIAIDLHCPWIHSGINETIYVVGNSDPAIEKQQIIFSNLLEKNTAGDLKLYHKDFIPFGTSWNTADNYTKGRSFAKWAGTLEGVRLSCTIEFPYANVSGIPVTKDGAREFGKAVAYSIVEYLESIDNRK
jgi:hypothetical protein